MWPRRPWTWGLNVVDGTHQLTESPVVNKLAAVLNAWCEESGRHFEVVRAEKGPGSCKRCKGAIGQ